MNIGEIQGYLLINFPHYSKSAREKVMDYLKSLGLNNDQIKSLGNYWAGSVKRKIITNKKSKIKKSKHSAYN